MTKETIGYYQSNIRTSRNEDSVYAMTYANQQLFIDKLQQENQELKKQLEECYCNRTDCSARIKDSKQYDSLVQKIENQQKEFIDWLTNESKELIRDAGYHQRICLDILSKYKEIIGVKYE